MNNLYMTTEEFAAMIVDTLDEQNYFKKGIKNHPSDIMASFVSTAETIAATMEWAIEKVNDIKLISFMSFTFSIAHSIVAAIVSAVETKDAIMSDG